MADHVAQSDNRKDDHKANHGDEDVEPDGEPTCIVYTEHLCLCLMI